MKCLVLPSILAVFCLSPALFGTRVEASSGGTFSVPLVNPKKPPKSGLTLTIDTTWVECNGYRPVRFTLRPTGTGKTERTLTLRFSPGVSYGAPPVTVTQDITLPAGAASATATMALPQLSTWQTYGLDVFEDGKPIDELSIPLGSNWFGGNQFWGDAVSPNALFLGLSSQPGATTGPSQFQLLFGRGDMMSLHAPLPPTPPGMMPSGGIASYAELPERWIDYSGLDLIFVPLPELTLLVEKQPQQWQAIREWVASGGNLVVFRLGDRMSQLGELEKYVDFPQEPGWTLPDPSIRGTPLAGATNVPGYAYPTVMPTGVMLGPNGVPLGSNGQIQNPPDASVSSVRFQMRQLSRGLVVAIDDDDLVLDRGSEDWTWLMNSIGQHRWYWYHRHGMSLNRDNQDFWKFLIPGVGLSPVTEFQVLISLFVLVIGPLNYFLLRRWQKLNLLTITVPASAGLITSALLLYALLADGLDTRTRLRTFTQIDQRRGEAVVWSRISYYAGLAPANGLVFPRDTAVLPYEPRPRGGQYDGSAGQPREVDWGERQYLGVGWLPARTPVQLITTRVCKSSAQLQIEEAPAKSPRVQNQLGTTIKQLFLVDSQGRYFEATGETPRGAVAQLQPSDAAKVAAAIRATCDRQILRLPAEMNQTRYESIFGMGVRYYYTQYDHQLEAPSQNNSRLERGFLELTEANALSPNSYVAIVERSPEVQVGLEETRDELSFHLILGRW